MIRREAPSAESLQSETDAAYDRWAPVYDLIFDLPFHAGRLAAARAADSATPPLGELLVVGVGTGLELELLGKRARVTGIDLSEPMLQVARRRVQRRALGHVKALIGMDAGAMAFEDASFDAALAPYVLTVVPDPHRVLSEMWRVLRPGGELIVMSHFSADAGLRARTEALLERSAGWLGWHPLFPFSILSDWVAAQPDAEWRERRTLGLWGLFTLARVGKRGIIVGG
jgi:phosphatidylethanolamine/phosphatidyl-N-methylethanolamine N-methyltransferase